MLRSELFPYGAIIALLVLAPMLPAKAELAVETLGANHPASAKDGNEEMVYEFPLVRGDSEAATRINTYLHAVELQVLPGRYRDSPFEAVWPEMQPPFHGMTGVSFDVVSQQPGYLSLAIYASYMAAYPTDNVRNYSFDANSGEPLYLSRLFSADGLNHFRRQVVESRIQRIDDFLAGKLPDAHGGKLSDDAGVAAEQQEIYSQCREDVAERDLAGSDVTLGANSLVLSGPSCAPRSQLAIDELGNFEMTFLFGELLTSLNGYGRCLLVEQRDDCTDERKGVGPGVYRGKIGGRYPITVVLQQASDGIYFYGKHAEAISLLVSPQDDGSVQLDEKGGRPARFDLRWANGIVTGTWAQVGKSPLAVELR